jgi:hypothetical protein
MKKLSTITVQKKVSATGIGKGNQVPIHGKGNTKGGGDNFKKTKNTIGVEPR